MKPAFRLIALSGGLIMSFGVRAADAPPGALSCSGCHAESRGVDTPAARLIGMSAVEIATAMRAYRAGQGNPTIMDRIARGFSENEIDVIAAWYAARRD